MIPFITVVMPVRNEAAFIRETLMQVLAQDYPKDRYEIIVADGMSDDGTVGTAAQIALEYPNVRIFSNEKRLSSAGRNLGFKYGKGDIFLVIDGHCFIEGREYLKNVVACFSHSGADCLGRPQPLDPPGLTEFQKAVAMARASALGHGGGSLIYSNYEGYASPVSNGAVYKKTIFQRIGYVDEHFDACEDVEFNYRVEKAGFKTYMSPLLTVKYYPRERIRDLYRQMLRYGRGRLRLIGKHRDTFSIYTIVPAFFVAGIAALCGAGITAPVFFRLSRFFIILLLLYAAYAALIVLESVRLAARNGCRYMRYLPLIFFIIHFGLGSGFLLESIKGGRK